MDQKFLKDFHLLKESLPYFQHQHDPDFSISVIVWHFIIRLANPPYEPEILKVHIGVISFYHRLSAKLAKRDSCTFHLCAMIKEFGFKPVQRRDPPLHTAV